MRLTFTALGRTLIDVSILEDTEDENVPDRLGVGFTGEIDPER